MERVPSETVLGVINTGLVVEQRLSYLFELYILLYFSVVYQEVEVSQVLDSRDMQESLT